MQIIRPDETDKPVAQIASLEKDENHENDHDRCRGEGRQKSRENALQDINRPRRRLMHFDLDEWMIQRLRRLPLRGLRRGRDYVFSNVFSSPCSASAAFSTMRAPKAEFLTASSFLPITT